MESDHKMDLFILQRKQRRAIFRKMIDVVSERIHKQGGGAISRGYGITHFTKTTGNRDPLAILLGTNLKDIKVGTIHIDENSKAVDVIRTKYSLQQRDTQYLRTFLGALEAVHDRAFDPFSKVNDRMGMFDAGMQQIYVDFQLGQDLV